MFRILAFCCFFGLSLARQQAAPQHSADRLPDTVFSCRDKVLGGYYADPDAQCQMFHVCVKVAGVGIQDYRFLCPNGTAFDQEAQICAGWADVACEPSALYYSSDNFDLYRIGSGFESKRHPAALEDESDFHLQRAEPDILSGAHSSNFFNNREGKDNQDSSKFNGGQNKNQVDQPRRKIVKKLQRRPTETTYDQSTTQRQFNNNFAGSFAPTTTARPTSFRSTPQEQQYSESYNNKQNYNNYQTPKQASSTATPSDFGKVPVSTYNPSQYQKTEKSTTQNLRAYNQRQPSTPDYRLNTESNVNYNNKQTTANNDAYNKNPVNYNSDSDSFRGNQQAPRRNIVSRQRGQQTYRNQQTSSSLNYNSQTSPQTYDSTSNGQYNANNNNKNTQSTQRFNERDNSKNFNNYNGGNGQNQETTYQIKYSSPSTQQTTPKYNNDFNQKQTQQYNTNNGENQDFAKTKSSLKYDEKKAFSTVKQSSTQKYNNYDNQQYNNAPQTPPPKFNTNLLYDNNQQSTPNYYKADYNNQEYKTNNAPVSANQYSNSGSSSTNFNNNQQPQYSTPKPFSFNNGVSPTQKSTINTQAYSTAQPTFNQGANQNYKPYDQSSFIDVPKASTAQPFYQGSSQTNHQFFNTPSTAYVQKISTAQPTSFNQGANFNQKSFEQKSSPQPTFNNAANYNQKSTANYQQYSTAQPSTFGQANNFNQQTSSVQQYSTTGRPASQYNQRQYEVKSFKSSKSEDYDDGQYRPEIHEREAGGEYDVTVRQPVKKDDYNDAQQESEFLKTAHSINIAASGNQLARDRARAQTSSPSTTRPPTQQVYQQPKITTQLPPKNVQITTLAPKSSPSNLPLISSTQPRPFSIRVPEPSAPQPKAFVESKTSSSSQAKPVSSQPKQVSKPQSKPASSAKAKDVSYDYAYYDNSDHSDHYSEYDTIEEFGRTSKKQ